MTTFKIMNVLLSDAKHFVNEPSLLCRSTLPWRREVEHGTWLLEGPGEHDFMTYFNALSIEKWCRYTTAEKFALHLELKGSACTVQQTRASAFSQYAEPVSGTQIDIEASQNWREFNIPLVQGKGDVLISFLLRCTGEVNLRNSYYYVEVEPNCIRDVELALCTTTFKKEGFITRNIDLVRSEILDSNEPIAQHFHMHVVDNGRTLDAQALSRDGITVHPNNNAGGAGGFARGMIEAMQQTPKATHVLLMDDDVIISTESIIRTFNILSLMRDEYVEAFVSGAMMSIDEPAMRWEDTGYVGWDGAFHPIKQAAHMDATHAIIGNESYDIPSDLPGCADQAQHYAAWWYCVIPMTQIERNGLPLPVFVRGDDVEYSRRCQPDFITMNGICVWHLSFHLRYNAAQERYQMTRNCLIDQATTNFAPLSNFEHQMKKSFYIELTKFNYANAELILRGIEDFLRGPEWLMQPVAQESFMQANRDSEKLVPFAELEEELSALGINLHALNDWNVWRSRPFSKKDRALLVLSVNGQRILPNYTEKGKVAVIDAVGWSDSYGKYQRAEVIVALDMPNGKGNIRHADPVRCKELVARWNKDAKELKARKDELNAAYSAARPAMTSVEFWRGYLGLDSGTE